MQCETVQPRRRAQPPALAKHPQPMVTASALDPGCRRRIVPAPRKGGIRSVVECRHRSRTMLTSRSHCKVWRGADRRESVCRRATSGFHSLRVSSALHPLWRCSRSSRPDRSAPVMIQLLRAPNQDLRSSSMTSSPGRSGATLMLPMTSPSFVCKSRTTIGRCQYVVGWLSSWFEQCVAKKMVRIRHEAGSPLGSDHDDPCRARGVDSA